MEQQDMQIGLATICIGLGQGIVTIIERVKYTNLMYKNSRFGGDFLLWFSQDFININFKA
ncbi:hypothetical protein M5E07_14740 [Acinetobacter tibetensis]|uniref:Uncharacterized protein n=1 Tax=Acinetobacter tibetensis TaxID=2943497 RepID=A0AAE9LQS4_9GAMM|nr:hypothetical protein [Acinetobacter tibetensis]USE83012.1 hypothetical protein M5E07_14740 [Acinetobacter tibetensis]